MICRVCGKENGDIYRFCTNCGAESAKTFDAGVALYAGMAIMGVAGSAVVIGKKKF